MQPEHKEYLEYLFYNYETITTAQSSQKLKVLVKKWKPRKVLTVAERRDLIKAVMSPVNSPGASITSPQSRNFAQALAQTN